MKLPLIQIDGLKPEMTIIGSRGRSSLKGYVPDPSLDLLSSFPPKNERETDR